MNKRFAFLLTLLILVPVILAACGGDDDDGEVTGDSLTNAFEEFLAGNPEPIKEISCEEQHTNIEESAAGISELADEDGFDISISCSLDGNAGSCDMAMTVEIEGQDPVETSETIDFELVDGKICEDLGATP